MKQHTFPKTWFAIQVPCPAAVEEVVSNFMFECGAEGVIQNEGALTAYFPGNVNKDECKASLELYLQDLSFHQDQIHSNGITIFNIPDRDWNAEWKKNLGPIIISNSLAIKPSWIKSSEHLAQNVIEIDPQMAFGTGSHATTRLILRLIEKYIRRGFKVLDVGTGSGILAIAAAKLGAAQVYAFDNDPVAVETAKINCQKNRVTHRISVFTGTIDTLGHTGFDVILANINRSVIVKILPKLVDKTNKPATILLSGILDEEEKLVCSEISQLGLNISEIQHQDEWVAFVVKKP